MSQLIDTAEAERVALVLQAHTHSLAFVLLGLSVPTETDPTSFEPSRSVKVDG